MIEIADLHVTFSPGTPLEKEALRGIALTIPEGQFVTVIGSNGAGKSTLLSAIAGEAPVERGRVSIDNTDVTKWSSPRRAGLVARVFQDPMGGSCAGLTILENIALAAARGKTRGARKAVTLSRRAAVRERVATLGLGLEDRLDERMGRLSGGQRQAVSLLMAAMAPSKILLLDEHTAALDPPTAAFVLDLTRRVVAEKGLTVLMVTHSMRQALEIGQRTLMLHEGKVVLDVAGEERAGLDVPQLLDLFAKHRTGAEIDDDSLLMG